MLSQCNSIAIATPPPALLRAKGADRSGYTLFIYKGERWRDVVRKNLQKRDLPLLEGKPFSFCRGDRTRTGDPYVPNVVRDQRRYTRQEKRLFSFAAAKLLLFFE